jgi:hypothetical protein
MDREGEFGPWVVGPRVGGVRVEITRHCMGWA